MKFSYKFSNLLGTIYRNGNLAWFPDGNSLISPVGNRLTIFDLKNNKARTLSLESLYNYTTVALSPDGSILIAVNERGEAQLISMVSCVVVHRHKFRDSVKSIVFSPDGKYFAVAMQTIVLIFRAPGELTGEYNPFVLERRYIGGHDDITWLDWSTDSRFLAVGCRDNTTKIIGVRRMNNFRTYILGGHTDAIVGCFFESESLHINTISRNGQLCLWECNITFADITNADQHSIAPEPEKKKKKKRANSSDEDESEDEIENTVEKENGLSEQTGLDTPQQDENAVNDEDAKKTHPFFYKKLGRHYLADEPRKEKRDVVLTAAHYNKRTKILVTGFSNGGFYLYEIPNVNMIHSLSMSDYAISTALFNCTGDWVALASRELGQLLVWEWQSEQYIMKQQGHSSEMMSIAYSPDGQYIASGGEDSKVKLWNTQSGFCFVTFNEHTSGVTGVQFSRNKKFLVSSSLDGTVRAFDITRYRNFRTFTAPRHVQFACVAIDYSGELVAAGGQDVFEIYLWSIKMGKLLEVISGHEGPVTTLDFSPVPTSSTLVSGSWDKTIKIWNCLENSSSHETIDLLADVVSLAFNPNGEHVAVATINGNISVFEIKNSTQISSIEGRNDLGSGRLETDVVTAKRNLAGKFFNTLEYSADGECLLAAGKSQMICIYHVREGILLKKFEITQNHSLDGLEEYVNRRHLSEFGNMALVEQREELEGGKVTIRLPGVQSGDMATRNFKPEIRVFGVKFSPTGQAFAAACTEGLCVYALDKGIVFDPFDLSLEVTPKAVNEALKDKDYLKALLMALKLNEQNIIMNVLEQTPYKDVELVCTSLPNEYAQRLMQNIARFLQTSPHIEFYLRWSRCLLNSHGNRDGVFQHPALLSLHESISRKYEMLNKICDFNKYTLRVLIDAADARQKSNILEKVIQSDDDSSSDADSDSDDNEDELMLIKSNTKSLSRKRVEETKSENESESDEELST